MQTNTDAVKNIAIIYHDADFDGKLSNEVSRFHLKRLHHDAAIHSYGWDYGRPLPTPNLTYQLDHNPNEPVRAEWSLYDAIYIVDLSVDELMARPELRDKIVWIDHHKSAIEKWVQQGYNKYGFQFTGYRIDGVAACRLCWQWFTAHTGPHGDPRIHPADRNLPQKHDYVSREVSEPQLIRLAGEYDIWDHRDPDAKALQFGLRALSDWGYRNLVDNEFMGAVTGARTCSDELNAAIVTGRSIKSYCDKQNDEYSAAYARTLEWEGLKFCCLNIGNANKMVSDTPRSDAEYERLYEIYQNAERIHGPLCCAFNNDMSLCRQLERELNAANERIKRLEEAGGQLMMWLGGDISDSNRKLLEDAWREAKEAKP